MRKAECGLKQLFIQAIKFIGLSGIGWILDFCTYIGLGFISENVVMNNFISSWMGVTFVFIFATRKVFKNNSKIPLGAKYVIYIVYQLFLITLISKILGGIDTFILTHFTMTLVSKFSSVLAKIIVTPITMILNFFVMKGVIEKI